FEPRGDARAERAPARQPEALRFEQGEDQPAEWLPRGNEIAARRDAARRAGPGPRYLQQAVSLELPRPPLELGPREDFHRVGPLHGESWHLTAVEAELRGDVAAGWRQEVAGRQRAGERIDKVVSHREPLRPDLLHVLVLYTFY